MRFGLLGLLVLLAARPALAAEYQPLPPRWAAGLSAEWLLHDAARNRLILYLPGYHAPARAYYQWLRLRPGQPFRISFAAQPGLSLLLNNQLVFTARAATTYSLDLARLLPTPAPAGPMLLAVWQPEGSPDLASFSSGAAALAGPGQPAAAPLAARPRRPGQQGENVFLTCVLLLGLSYGGLRASYRPGLSRIFQVEDLFGSAPDQQSFLTRPAFTLLNLLLVVLFAFALALLLVAIHTNLQNLPLVRQLLDVPESAIVVRVLLYTLLIAGLVLGKYLFLELMGYIFDVQGLVNIHYREFLRSLLLAGLGLPLVLVLYISFNATRPAPVNWVANAVVLLLLSGTVLRVARTLHRHSSLLTLQLFAYLCTTEILPLAVILKLIVFA
ncbi:DUF4271 domain-containing protein [uncultured Hymenobacter sp.]|uniref:DUF4271 domain-containing protein n=1 Tax=uncultured Hymenobacter sp. TaxID=170016 RepID=UPI0035CA41C9